MEKIQHKEFMTSNKLEGSIFSEPVQKKVKIFDKMHSNLEDTVGEDHKELLVQLKELDLEIREDMLDELEEELENNEVVEEPEPKKDSRKEVKPEKKPETKKVRSDESILDELWKIGRTKGLSRSFIKECGIGTDISSWTVHIGKYKLHRAAVFSYKYNLEKLKS